MSSPAPARVARTTITRHPVEGDHTHNPCHSRPVPAARPAAGVNSAGPDSARPVDVRRIFPVVVPQDHCPVQFTDTGFRAETATVTLNQKMRCAFTHHSDMVSVRTVDRLGLGLGELWRRAAMNLIDSAWTSGGTTFFYRNACALTGQDTCGLQIASPGGRSVAWLAHPESFTMLSQWASTKLGGDLFWYAPDPRQLVVVPAAADQTVVHSWARRTVKNAPSQALTDQPMVYSLGFPVPRGW
ncbi:hypothetical protein ACFSSC_11485 [Corynebacterium mendelii]|uniref:Uncharacterized protein n=1 Tax=Corynebacterium mendelii TaxID=2765362 RepID=A0A939IXF7_9CORY|nr:hypothetical protein [Corynebacterium mendelii]MBN9643627.1 hypothetical protein [Corynebacterium mendelii]